LLLYRRGPALRLPTDVASSFERYSGSRRRWRSGDRRNELRVAAPTGRIESRVDWVVVAITPNFSKTGLKTCL
jgi:hypothetical protein